MAAQAGFQLAVGERQRKIGLEVPVMAATNRCIVLLRPGVWLRQCIIVILAQQVVKIIVLIGAVIYVGRKFFALLFVLVIKVDIEINVGTLAIRQVILVDALQQCIVLADQRGAGLCAVAVADVDVIRKAQRSFRVKVNVDPAADVVPRKSKLLVLCLVLALQQGIAYIG